MILGADLLLRTISDGVLKRAQHPGGPHETNIHHIPLFLWVRHETRANGTSERGGVGGGCTP